MAILKIVILGYLEAFYGDYSWNKSCLILKLQRKVTFVFVFFYLSIIEAKKRKHAILRIMHQEWKLLKFKSIQGYLKFFSRLCRNKICSKLLIEGLVKKSLSDTIGMFKLANRVKWGYKYKHF